MPSTFMVSTNILTFLFSLSHGMKCEWQTENPCYGTFFIRSQIIIFRHAFIIASIGALIAAIRLNVFKHQMVVDLLGLFRYDAN